MSRKRNRARKRKRARARARMGFVPTAGSDPLGSIGQDIRAACSTRANTAHVDRRKRSRKRACRNRDPRKD